MNIKRKKRINEWKMRRPKIGTELPTHQIFDLMIFLSRIMEELECY